MKDQDLSDQIKYLERKYDKRFKSLEDKMQEVHDYIVDLRGFFRGQESVKDTGDVKISKEVWALIKKLVYIIGTVAAGILLILEATK